MEAANKAILSAEDIVAGHYRRFLNALTVFGPGLASEKKKAEKAAAKEGSTTATDAENDSTWDTEAWDAWEAAEGAPAK
eukprot:s6672_g3.t1